MTAGPDDLDLITDLGMDIARRVRASRGGLDQDRGSLILLLRVSRRLICSARYVPDEIDALLAEAIEADIISGLEI